MATDADWGLRESYLYDRRVIAEIQRAAREGIYDIRGFGAKRKVPHFDDLLFLGASVSRYPLEGYRERCATDVVLGTRFARRPLELKIPVTIAGMSFVAVAAPSAIPPQIGRPNATSTTPAVASAAPTTSTCELVTASDATSGDQAQSAAHQVGRPIRRSTTTSPTVTPSDTSRPATWNGRYWAVAGTKNRTAANHSCAIGG